MSFEAITNRGEFFSDHYLDAVIGNDLKDLRRTWDDVEGRGESTARSRLRGAATDYFDARAVVSEATTADRQVAATQALNDVTLTALGFTPERQRVEIPTGGTETLEITLAHDADAGTGRLLEALDAGVVSDIDELFDNADDAAGLLLEPAEASGEKDPITSATEAVAELFATDDPPRYVVIAAGHMLLLAERSKWAEGRYLAVDLDAMFERLDTTVGGELDTVAGLFSADTLVPGFLGDDEGRAPFEDLVESSFKHAVGVSKDLRHGMRQSVEILANEVIRQRLAAGRAVYDGADAVDPTALTHQCLRWLYRLVVLLYAESRPELGVVPVNDEAYVEGYSLDRLRELTLVDLDTEASRNGSHLHESLRRLFHLVNDGYHAEHAEQALVFDTPAIDAGTREEYLQFPGLDAGLFDDTAAPLLDGVTLRNEALQKVLALLMLSPEGKGKKDRGFISYAQLGINQLGAVYEGLMAYSGFFATDGALFEVAKHGDPSDGTWVLPVDKADDYPDDVFVTTTDPLSGREEPVRHEKGSFVYRLSGRDRQRSASYYTPEVLTRCVVKHALAELLGLDDYAPENGSSGITRAEEILDLTICEPALGSGAFLNEAINQLSAEYLRRRQEELGESLDPETYRRELQKVKAHFALHQSYGVDLNATAVELAEVSLWLNCMHPGLKAPWFGLQLRRGNSLVGCRRATWRTGQLGGRPWANTKKGEVVPPEDRPLAEELEEDEIHHFLLPGHGWAAVADRKEAKEFRPDEVEALKDWRKKILKAPGPSDAKRLTALAGALEEMWARAAERIRLTQQALRRPIDVFGAAVADREARISRAEAERVLDDPDSALGRLRTLMDAWVGLWFWPVDGDVEPPTWKEWLDVAEELLAVDERHGPSGQLGFEDLEAFLDSENDEPVSAPVAELREENPWLDLAAATARREGAWHWDLEFAPAFYNGGFDLQVGNPPWVRLDWLEDVILAERDPWWGTTAKAPAKVKEQRRSATLSSPSNQAEYLDELASAEGLVETLGSPVFRPVLTGVRTNLYMVFMDTTWRHLHHLGAVGLLHPESHFTDPKGAALRAATYRHSRRHFQFYNELILFEDVHHMTQFSANVYGLSRDPAFVQASALYHPDTVDRSLTHDGSGEAPGLQYASGGWDLRPHQDRLLTITEDVLTDWARLFDEPGTPASEARLLRPVVRADLEALSVLADQPTRLGDHDYHWTQGWNETNARTDGILRWETSVPDSWEEVILQGPHFTVATPFAKQPNENCQNNLDWSEWDLENLPESVIPRTNYQRACDRDSYDANLDVWNGRRSTEYVRLVLRRMTQAGSERSLHMTMLPPGPAVAGTCYHGHLPEPDQMVVLAGLGAALPLDYMVKVSGRSDIHRDLAIRFPLPRDKDLKEAIALRVLRLTSLTAIYKDVWRSYFAPAWRSDNWTDDSFQRIELGDVGPQWTVETPLSRDYERRLALVELDALAAIAVGLSAEQLCALYRSQFAVLRKYEYSMAFDAEGRKICAKHQSAGYRQAHLQDQAKEGKLPKEWKSIWRLYEQYEEDPSSVDWLGHYTPPFTRPDREKEMTRAYEEFQRRLDAGEYR